MSATSERFLFCYHHHRPPASLAYQLPHLPTSTPTLHSFSMFALCLPVFGRLCGTAGRDGDGDVHNHTRIEAGANDVVATQPRPTSMPMPGKLLAHLKPETAGGLPTPVQVPLAPTATKVAGLPANDALALRVADLKDPDGSAASTQLASLTTVQIGRQALAIITNKAGIRARGKALTSRRRNTRDKEKAVKRQQRAPRRPHRRLSAAAAHKDSAPRAYPTPSVAPAFVNAKIDLVSGSRRISAPAPSPPVSAPASTFRFASAPALLQRAPPKPAPAPAQPEPEPALSSPAPATPPSPAPARVSSLPPSVTSSPPLLRVIFEGLTRRPQWPDMLKAAGLEYTGEDQCEDFDDADIAAFFGSPEWVMMEEWMGVEVPMPRRDSTINHVEVAPAVKNTQRREVEDVFWSAPSSSPARRPSAPAPVSSPPPSSPSLPRALRAAFEEVISLRHWAWLLEISGTTYTPADNFQRFTDAEVVAFFASRQWSKLSKCLGRRYSWIGRAAAKSA
ncbi:hypothetical protein C8R47DRAFT_320391 [Mycena vitilis]|nr:hypothetical protein C8R47DRAFT_320391 [Mycena vitilis]